MQSIAGGIVPHAAPHIRDDRWLHHVLESVWARHFPDTPRLNTIRVNYGAAWKNRLGLITMSHDQTTSFIQINALLRLRDVPDCVSRITVAHEMVHYAHGFGSPLPRRYKHPHRGGIVKRELLARGMAGEYAQYDDWIYNRWFDFYAARAGAFDGFIDVFGVDAVASRLPPDE
jgi:hypothetical protein